MERLPERIEGEGVLIRRWRVEDAERQHEAIAASAEHLRPWMPWMAEEPLELDARRALLAGWEQAWSSGGDVFHGVFVDGRVAGSCGLHRRVGPAALEIGYWVHPAFVRQGLATEVTRLLTDAAFTSPGVLAVEIHHDRANVASAGVARRAGFRLIAERADRPDSPAEAGIEWVWRMEREEWVSRSAGAPPPAPGHAPVKPADGSGS